VSTQGSASDTTTRVQTQSGAQISQSNISPQAGTFNNSGDTQYGFPGVSSTYRPGDIFGALFGRNTPSEGEKGNTPSNPEASEQSASVAQSGVLGSLWHSLFGGGQVDGADDVVLSIVPTGSENPGAHTPVEYVVTYSYRLSTPAKEAYVRVILPDTVVYIGDTTANELLLERGTKGERMYVLPIGTLKYGDMRTFSLLGMTTAKASGYPKVKGELVYSTHTGVVVVGSTDHTLSTTASAGVTTRQSDDESILPSSFLGWLFYVIVIALVIVGVRKARAYYLAKKEELEAREAESRALPRMFVDELPQPN
jgi:hypothetical protein